MCIALKRNRVAESKKVSILARGSRSRESRRLYDRNSSALFFTVVSKHWPAVSPSLFLSLGVFKPELFKHMLRLRSGDRYKSFGAFLLPRFFFLYSNPERWKEEEGEKRFEAFVALAGRRPKFAEATQTASILFEFGPCF